MAVLHFFLVNSSLYILFSMVRLNKVGRSIIRSNKVGRSIIRSNKVGWSIIRIEYTRVVLK